MVTALFEVFGDITRTYLGTLRALEATVRVQQKRLLLEKTLNFKERREEIGRSLCSIFLTPFKG